MNMSKILYLVMLAVSLMFVGRGGFCGETGIVSIHLISDMESADTISMKLRGKDKGFNVEKAAQLTLADMEPATAEGQYWQKTSTEAAEELGIKLSPSKFVLHFIGSGKEKLNKITSENVGKRLGVVINGELVKAFRINEPNAKGEIVISGVYSKEEAEAVAREINKERTEKYF